MNVRTMMALLGLLVVVEIGRSDPLDHWTWRNPVPTGKSLSGVVYGAGQFVSVGYDTILTSPDGITWKARDFGGFGELLSVAHGNTRFVAVGDAGIVLSSSDGTNWISSNVGAHLQGVTYGNNQFVAVGDHVLTSPDGQAWTTRIAVTDDYLRSVAYGVGRFVTVGEGGAILRSEDGLTWTNSSFGTNISFSWLAFGNGTFVASGYRNGSQSVLVVSADGITWTNSSFQTPVGCLAYLGNQFMGMDDRENVLTSPDGITWTQHFVPNTGGIDGFAYGNNQFVAVGGFGTLFTSPDGAVWTDRNPGTSRFLQSVAYVNNQFVVLGQQGPYSDDAVFLASADGRTWTDCSPGSASYASSIAYGNGRYVAVGQAIFSSSDGTNWTTSTSQDDLNGIVYANNQFIAVGLGGKILSSPDGVVWTNQVSGTAKNLSAIAYGNNQFVIGGEGGTILTSLDGTLWASRDAGVTNQIMRIAYGNHVFVALVIVDNYPNSGRATLTSTNGTNWTYHEVTQGDVNYDALAFGDNQFVAIFGNVVPTFSSILTSPDGVMWTWRSRRGQALNGLAFGNDSFVAVGDFGAILQSDPFITLAVTPGSIARQLTLSLTGPTGLAYTVQRSSDLISWQTVTNISSVLPTTVIPDALPAAVPHAFYRAYVPEP